MYNQRLSSSWHPWNFGTSKQRLPILTKGLFVRRNNETRVQWYLGLTGYFPWWPWSATPKRGVFLSELQLGRQLPQQKLPSQIILHGCYSGGTSWDIKTSQPMSGLMSGQHDPSALTCSASQALCHLLSPCQETLARSTQGTEIPKEKCLHVLWNRTKRGDESSETKTVFCFSPKDAWEKRELKNTLSPWLRISWKNSSQPREIIQIPGGDVRCDQRDIPSAAFLETQYFLERCLVFPEH